MRQHFRGNRVTLTHLKTVRKPSGAVYHYLRAPGCQLVRLPDLPLDSPAFLAAYAAALAGAKAPRLPSRYPAGSIGAVAASYEASDAFKHLSPATKARRRVILGQIVAKAGAGMIRDLKPRHIDADIAPLSPHPANARLKTWRGMCSWAKDAGLLIDNPAPGAKPKRIPKSDGHETWAADDIVRFRAHWPIGTAQRLTFELLFWTAVRVADSARLGPGMVDKAGWLVFRQGKTGGEVAVPLARALPAFAVGMQGDLDQLRAALDARPERHMTFLTTEAGAARSVKALSMWFVGAAKAAGVMGKSAHGLRKSRATLLAEAGATEHQIGAWTGHESLTEVRRYTRKADKRRILSGEKDQEGNVLETDFGSMWKLK